ncbi:MAG: type II secretion system protein [Pirellulales bacterium]|nr:type II secretion system protein [Pirellulales bacterium]
MMRRKGFTLVELVVVILILGILAGVAAPKMFNTSAKATDNGLKQTVSIVRDAIEMYQSQNGGLLPACNATGSDLILLLKPYLRGSFPKNPLYGTAVTSGQVKGVAGATLTPDELTGWMYSNATGEFIINSSDASATDGSVQYNQF